MKCIDWDELFLGKGSKPVVRKLNGDWVVLSGRGCVRAIHWQHSWDKAIARAVTLYGRCL